LRKHLQNQRGQAIAEAVLMSSLILTGTFFLLAVFMNQILSIAIDDALETYFYCQIQKKETCKNTLNTDLNTLYLKNIRLSEKNYPPYFEITLTAQTSFNYEFSKKRQLNFDREIHLF
jgi:hypothetical protein